MPKNPEIGERIKEIDERRLENVIKKFEEKKIDLKGDVIGSFNKMDHWKRLNFTYNQVYFNLKKASKKVRTI